MSKEEEGAKANVRANLSTGKSQTRSLLDRRKRTKLPSLLLSDAYHGVRPVGRAVQRQIRFSESDVKQGEGRGKGGSTRLTSIILSTRLSSLGSSISGGA